MILKFKKTMLCFTLLTAFFAWSQTPETKPEKQIDFALEGILAVSYGSKTLGINVGGPSLKLRLNKFKIGIGAFPSLIISDGKAIPRLAVSPILEYRKIMFITPYYGYDSKNNMIWTFGAGYKFL